MRPYPNLLSRRIRARDRALTLALVGAVLAAGSASAGGKPGYPTTVNWGGGTWQIKTSNAAVGPGPNVFSAANVSVDANGYLHLWIKKNGAGTWTCAEVISPASYGYGRYTFELGTAVDALDPNVVLGLFTWSDKAPYAHREIDIEASRWGVASETTNAQFVVQPWNATNHLQRFTHTASTPSKEIFEWTTGQIAWRTLDATETVKASYSYRGADIPVHGDERVRINLWLYQGSGPTDGRDVEVIVRSFTFTH